MKPLIPEVMIQVMGMISRCAMKETKFSLLVVVLW